MRALAQTSGLSPQPGVYQGLPSLRRGAGARPPRAPPPTFLQPAASEGESSPPATKKAGRRDGRREGAGHQTVCGFRHTHTHCGAACIHPLLPAVRPFATLPAPARDHSKLPGQKRGGGHRKEGGAGRWKAGGAVWRGPAPQAGVLPGPAPSGSELRWAWEGASSPFVPYPSAPLPDTLTASRRCRSLRSPYPVWRSGAGGGDASFPFRPHGERWEAREELRPCACEGKWGCRGATTASQPALGSLRTGRRAGRNGILKEMSSAGGSLALRRRRPARAGPGAAESWP